MRMWECHVRVGRSIYGTLVSGVTGTQVNYSVLFVEQLFLLSDVTSDIVFYLVIS